MRPPRWWPFPDRARAWLRAAHNDAPVPGPRALGAYARLPVAGPLPPRLRELVRQLAAVRSGCEFCALQARHEGLAAGVSPAALDAVCDYAGAADFSEAERAALSFADAVTHFAAALGGLPEHALEQARRHFNERQIQAFVSLVASQHFFDPVSGRLGADARGGP